VIPGLLQLLRDLEHRDESVAETVNDKALDSLRRMASRVADWAKTDKGGITDIEFSLVFAPHYLRNSQALRPWPVERILEGLAKAVEDPCEWQRHRSVGLLLTLAEDDKPGSAKLMKSIRNQIRSVCMENWKLWEQGKKLGIIKENDPWPETRWRSRTK
jgi:hypothetical protein